MRPPQPGVTMMHRRKIFGWTWLALALMAAPAPLAAQQTSQDTASAAPSHWSRGHGPVEKLLRHRADLNLSEAQVARLEEINRRMEERNRPLVRQLVEMRRQWGPEFRRSRHDMTPEQRAELSRRMEEARPLVEQIHENNRSAMREVGEVLNPEQKASVREMLRRSKEHHEKRKRHGSERDERRN